MEFYELGSRGLAAFLSVWRSGWRSAGRVFRWLRVRGRRWVSRRTDPRARLGRRAEWFASAWLRLHGHALLARRFPTPFAEVDLVTIDGPDLVVVEVKARRGPGEIDVHPEQRARLARAAQWLDHCYGVSGSGIRVDLCRVEWPMRRLGWPRVTHERAMIGEDELERREGEWL